MLTYSTIKEATEKLEKLVNKKVIDGYREGKYYVLIVAGNSTLTKVYSCIRFKIRIPE